jgi:hypothetical protein
MYSVPIALVLAQGAAQEARSALPGAPVVPHVDRVPVAPRMRKTVAGGLRHLADVVAPPRSVGPVPVPSGPCGDAG